MHRYPELMIRPLRDELTSMGAQELRTPEAVDEFVQASDGRTAMLVINSVCGCSAASLRPGLKQALERVRPDLLATAFAGADLEAVERARELAAEYPPSSPAVAIFRDRRAVFMLQRHQIQGKPPEAVAGALVQALEAHGGDA